MVRGRRILVGKTSADRKRLRATLGPLRTLKVSPCVQTRYDRAVSHFLWWCVTYFGILAGDFAELDQQASYFILAMWEEGEPRSIIADTLSGLLHKLERKKILSVSWSWLSVWERHEMPNRAPPLLTEMALALAGLFLHFSLPEMACAVIVGFHCMLRTAEILSIRKCHIAWSRGKASITVLGKTSMRTGHIETVIVEDPLALLILMALCETKGPMDLMFSGTAYRFRQFWAWGISCIGFDSTAYKPYAIRRGGATEDWARYLDAGRLLMRGRWGSMATARIYAVEGLRVRDSSLVDQMQTDKMLYWGKIFGYFIGKLQEVQLRK
jgi:hypothetical protein